MPQENITADQETQIFSSARTWLFLHFCVFSLMNGLLSVVYRRRYWRTALGPTEARKLAGLLARCDHHHSYSCIGQMTLCNYSSRRICL